MTEQLDLFDLPENEKIHIQIESQFPQAEYYDIEYKSAQGGFPREFWKTYSAFANTNSGIIVLGVSEKRGNFSFDGLTDVQINKLTKQFWDECNNPNTVSKNLLTNHDVKAILLNEKKLLVFKIPFANRTERPVYLTRNPFSNTYKRNHEGDYRCTDEEVKRMIADSSAELRRDNLILENYTIDDLDNTTLRIFRQLFSSTKPGHPWLGLEDLDLLKKIGAYRTDRKTQQGGITLAGLLMFGKEDSIMEQTALPNYFPDFRENTTQDPQVRWTDRICPDGTWECNLLQFYLKVWPKLSSTLPKSFKLKDDQRIDESSTHVALREAFVNAIVHTDYSLSGNIVIEHLSDQFIFSNPGTLLVSINQFYSGGISECRNPSLQQMFMLIGRAEKAGSGIDKILKGWQDSHWRKPFVERINQPDRVKLTLPLFSVIPDKILNELNLRFGDVKHLSPEELTTLSICLIEGAVSNHRLQYALNSHSSDITKLLKKLCVHSFLQSDNNGRWTIYELAEVATSLNQVATPKNQVATSSEKDENHSSISTSPHRNNKQVATSIQQVATPNDESDILSRAELESQILQYCNQRYRTKKEIAKFTNKGVDYLRNKVLNRMVSENKLSKKYPHTTNHPEQAYITTSTTNENE